MRKKRRKGFKYQLGGNVAKELDTPEGKKGKKKLRRYLKKQEKKINEVREEYVEQTFENKLEGLKDIFNAQYGDTGANANALTPRSGIQLMKKGGKVKKKKGSKYQLGGISLLGNNQLPEQTVQAPDALGVNNSAGNFLMPGVLNTFSPLLPSGSQLQELARSEEVNRILQAIGETPGFQLGGGVTSGPIQEEQQIADPSPTLGGLPVDPAGLLTNDGSVVVPSRDITFKPGGIALDEVTIVTPIPGLDAVVETPIAAITLNERDEDKKSTKKRKKRRKVGTKKRKNRLDDVHQPINNGRKC